jgi:membrane-associated PAP2 superfamily phosphatase
VVAASAITVPLAVSLLKSQSIHHCPWDLQRYGGFALYLRLFDKLPAGAVAGHCFPAGHASSGLWLAAFAVFWLPERPRMAAIVFALGLVPGLLMGWMQQMRGAHFLSHTLWSAWIATLVFVLTARFLYPHR